MFKLNLRNLIFFFFIWGCVGFVLGTEILMGPSRWIIDLSRSRQELDFIEGPAIRTLMLLLIAVSLPASLFITRTILQTSMRHVRYGLAAIILICLALTLYMWFNPKKFGNNSSDTFDEANRFTVGSYPDREKLVQLKQDGYTGVISLLHPAVVPFETSLIAQEEKNAAEAGIEMIHLPMLPWVSENKKQLERLREIAKSGDGKYYLHCYLGKDRVSVAMKTIADADPSYAMALGQRARQLRARYRLERGSVFMPADNIYVTPYPTHEEYFAYIIAANITNVVCLMNPAEGESAKIITKSEKILSDFNIKQINIPISREKYNYAEVTNAVQSVKAMQGPVLVFDFYCPSFRTEAFVQAYNDSRPVMPPSLLQTRLLVGETIHIAPNVVAGSRPERLREFVELEELGITKFLYIGQPDDEQAVRDRQFTATGEFDWQITPPDIEAVTGILKQDGPWYIYGPGLEQLIAPLTEKLGPAYTKPFDHVARLTAENTKPPAQTRFAALMQNLNPPAKEKVYNPVTICINFLKRAVPSPKMIILLSPFFLLYTYICACFAGWLKTTKNVKTSYTRKIFHFLIFTTACFVQFKGGLPATILYGSIVSSCVLYAIYRGDGFGFYEAMARPTDAPHRTLYIFIPLVTTALGGVISNMFFQPVAMIGYLVGGWGDAIGEPVGTKWGKHKYKVPSMMGVPATRSAEGSAAVMTASFLAALLGLMLLGVPFELAAPTALICSLAAVSVEAVSTHGLDNLTVQVTASAVVYLMLRTAG